MEKLQDLLLYPFVQAKDHFAEAQESEWCSRTVILYGAAAIKFVPLINYLVVIVEYVALRIFSAVQNYRAPKPEMPLLIKFGFTTWIDQQLAIAPPSLPPDEFTTWLETVLSQLDHLKDLNEEGLNGHRAALKKFLEELRDYIQQEVTAQDTEESTWQSCFLTKIEPKLQERLNGKALYDLVNKFATESKTLCQNRHKIRELGLRIDQLTNFLIELQKKIKAITEDPRLKGYDFSAWNQCSAKIDANTAELEDLVKTVTDECKALDQGRQKALEQKLRHQLSDIPSPQFTTLYAYFKSLEIKNFVDEVGTSRDKLRTYGLTNFQDLEKLQLNRFQDSIQKVKELDCCRKFDSAAQSLFDGAVSTLIRELREIAGSEAIVSHLQGADLDFAQIETYDKQRQITELNAYVCQYGNLKAWTRLKEMGILTLTQCCTTNDIVDRKSLFRIGDTYGGN